MRVADRFKEEFSSEVDRAYALVEEDEHAAAALVYGLSELVDRVRRNSVWTLTTHRAESAKEAQESMGLFDAADRDLGDSAR